MYYSATLDGLYQAAQNMAKNHLCGQSQNQQGEDGNTVASAGSAGSGNEPHRCRLIPGPARRKLMSLRDCKKRAAGGKKYWAEGARVLGVRQDHDGLRFAPIMPTTNGTKSNDIASVAGLSALPPVTSTGAVSKEGSSGSLQSNGKQEQQSKKKVKKKKMKSLEAIAASGVNASPSPTTKPTKQVESEKPPEKKQKKPLETETTNDE